MTIFAQFNRTTSLKLCVIRKCIDSNLKLLYTTANQWHPRKSSRRTHTEWAQKHWQSNFGPTTQIMSRLIARAPQRHQLYTQHRCYASDSDEQDRPTRNTQQPRLPELMDTPFVVWPSVIHTIRNWIFVTFIIKPYLDKEFCIKEFGRGSKQALEVVSNRLAAGDFQSLNGLVESETLATVRRNIERMSMAQRSAIAVNREEVYFSFPYQVGIIFDDSEEDEAEEHKRFVEITMVFHTVKKKQSEPEHTPHLPLDLSNVPALPDITICIYRFVKEFTKGVESDWTINMVNHVKTSDIMQDRV